ncbi:MULTISPECIES: flagellar biosynthesis repressor FlbT [Methylobacterium]|uniref:flagellar biosynthesis repressor FlbT n=2 Tax=Methylobacteriaceae TaxID=119045 RepID=UPI0011C93E04|nr:MULTISPECIES: flagellar biosynthesis repressor FlbT [Methylobacterium]TXN46318.1 flagellar protein FlbT [Methylobacterium sp. WL7]GJE24117.1 flagellum biosynthesis repressor protein FlbT [Methylobacterium mesophilicum]
MPLRLELKPLERLIINGALIRNGDRRSTFLIETQCKFLRESEIITESEADTACKQIHLTLTVIYLADDPAASIDLFFRQAGELIRLAPAAAPQVAAIAEAVEAGSFYPAIKLGRKLVEWEGAALAQAATVERPAPDTAA